jgi:hypothetical protein
MHEEGARGRRGAGTGRGNAVSSPLFPAASSERNRAPSRIESNFKVISLTDDEVAEINKIGEEKPARFNRGRRRSVPVQHREGYV